MKLTESQEELNKLLDLGANRTLEIASPMGFPTSKGDPAIESLRELP